VTAKDSVGAGTTGKLGVPKNWFSSKESTPCSFNRSYYLISKAQNDLEPPFMQSLFSGNSSIEANRVGLV